MDFLLAARVQVSGVDGAIQSFERLERAIGSVSRAQSQFGTTNAGQLSKGLDDATEKASRLERAFDRVVEAGGRMASYAVWGGMIKGMHDVVDAALQLDKALTNAISIAPNAAPFRGEMEKLARTLAVDLAMPVQKVGEGFYFLASAGLNVKEQLAALPVVAQFAKAGMMDLAEATEVASQAWAIFRAQGRSIAEVTDVITQAANVSQGTIAQFADALTNKAGTAAIMFGQSLEDSTAVLAAFAQRGIAGKVAGEQLSIVMRDMAIKARQNEEAFLSFGISVFDSAGNMRSIVDIANQMSTALGGMSDKQRGAALEAMGFTLRSQAVIQTLLASVPAINEYQTAMEKAGGATKAVADIQLTSIIEQLNKLKSFSIEIGLKGVDLLKEFAGWLIDTFGPRLRELGDGFKPMIEGIGAVGAAIGGLTFVTAREGLEAIAEAIGAIGRFAAEHEGAIFAVGVAIGTLVVANTVAGGITLLQEAFVGMMAVQQAAGLTRIAQDLTAMVQLAPQIRSVGDAVTVLKGGFSGIAAAINPVTIALLGIGAVVGAFVYEWKKAADEARENAKELVDAFRQVGVAAEEVGTALSGLRTATQGGSALDDLSLKAREAVENFLAAELATKGLSQGFLDVGLSMSDVAAALATGTDVFNNLGKQGGDAVHILAAAARDADPAVRNVAAALLEAYQNGSITFNEMAGLAKVFDATADASDDLLESFEKGAREGLNMALVTGKINQAWLEQNGIMDLSKAKVTELIDAWAKYNGIVGAEEQHDIARFRNLASLGPGAATAVQQVGKSAEEAKKSFEEFATVIEDVVNSKLAKFTGETGMQKAWQDLVKTVGEVGWAFDETGQHISSTSEAGQKLRDSLAGVASQTLEYAKAQAQGDPVKYAQGLTQLVDAFLIMAQNMGLSREQAEALAKELGLIEGVKTAQVEVELNDKKAKAEFDLWLAQERYMRLTVEADIAEATGRLDEAAKLREAAIRAKAEVGEAQGELDQLTAERTAKINGSADLARAQSDIDTFARTPWETIVRGLGDVSAADGAIRNLVNAEHITTIAALGDTSSAERAIRGTADHPWQANIATGATTEAAERAIRGTADHPYTAMITADGNAAPADQRIRDVSNFPYSAYVTAYAETGEAEGQIAWLARTRQAYINLTVRAGSTVPGMYEAHGGVVDYFARGGFSRTRRENHVAQIAPAGAMRVWAEPETGGEAYIPLASSKRKRSTAIWWETGRRLGMVDGYAAGGFSRPSSPNFGSRVSAVASSVRIAPGAVQVQVDAPGNTDPMHLRSVVQDAMGPAFDEFTSSLIDHIRRRRN